MYLEPVHSVVAQRLALCEEQQAPVDVGPHVVEVRWHRLTPSPEVNVVWEPEAVHILEVLNYFQLHLQITQQTEVILLRNAHFPLA